MAEKTSNDKRVESDEPTDVYTEIVPFDAATGGNVPPLPPTFADPDDDSEFIPKPPFKFTPLTLGLIGLFIIGAGFLIGVVVDKNFGDSSSSSGSGRSGFAGLARGTGSGFGGEGFGAGGFGGASGFGGGTGSGSGSAGEGAGTGSSGGSDGSVPAVIGTVASHNGTTLTVKNLGGKTVTVTLSASTKVTAPYGKSALATGTTVSVSGTTASNGTVAATAVVAN